MLQQVVEQTTTVASLLVKDDRDIRGDILLAQIAHSYTSKGRKCIFICAERIIDAYNGLDFVDPWEGITDSKLTEFLDSILDKAEISKGALCTLSDEQSVLQWMRRLLQVPQCSYFAILHRNTVTAFFQREAEHLCSATLTLEQNTDRRLSASATMLHMKTGGSRPTASYSLVSTTATGKLHITPLAGHPLSVTFSHNTDDTQKEDNPLQDLTFNLKLSADERTMRAQTALPYAKTQEEKSRYLRGSGMIYYEPDEVDDFDDEDPDDDLDI